MAIDQQVSSALWQLQLSNPALIKRTHFGMTSSPDGPRQRAECTVLFMFDALRVKRRAAGCILNWDAMSKSSFHEFPSTSPSHRLATISSAGRS
jgi:hypothetical protein